MHSLYKQSSQNSFIIISSCFHSCFTIVSTLNEFSNLCYPQKRLFLTLTTLSRFCPIFMASSKPYQPSLLRFLHSLSATLAILALVTSFIVYNNHDGRFGKIPLPAISDIISLHGTFGLFFLLVFPTLALYSFHLGQKRLIQADTFKQLTQIGKPAWWYSLHRLTNTLMLLSATFAVVTGRMVKEEWLETGDLNHIWYSFHLLGWVILFSSLLLHLLMIIKVGGAPLLLSMINLKNRDRDSPKDWVKQIQKVFNLSQE